MRRSKIRPSINLAASRRSTQTSAVKVDTKAKKTAVKTPPKAPIPCTVASPKNGPETLSAKPTEASHAAPKDAGPESARPESPRSCLDTRSESVSHETTNVQKGDKPTEMAPDTDVAVADKVPSPDTSNQVPETAATPSQAKDNSNPQRRRRISAKPNLGQHRMRLPLPSATRREKRSETVHKNTDIGTSDGGSAAVNSDVAKPSEPPPVRRVVESIKNAEIIPNTGMVTAAHTTIRELSSTSTQPKPQPLKPTVHPKAVQHPSRPDRLVEKRAALPPTIQDKRIRDLKALEAETPAKRRKRYIKKTSPPDRSKMTMSDLIYYNPKANPMKSAIVTKEKVKPLHENNNSLKEKSSAAKEADGEEEEEGGINPMAPQVRIDADGNIVLDKESLTIEASPARKFVIEDAEVVHEDSSNVTYASFRKRIHTTAWSKMETEKFFSALSMVGTDFTMMNVLFPKRTRHQIKNKFKREERVNRLRIDKAIREKIPLDRALFETADSDEDNEGDKTTKGEKPGANETVATSEKAQLDDEEAEFNENWLDNDSDHDDGDVEVTNILARPTRSGRMPKVRVNYDNSTDIDDQPVDGGIVRHIGSSPMVNGTVQRTPGGTTPGGSGVPPAQGTPTTPMQTIYVVTPLQGGKQFMIRQHTIPQPSPDAIQLALEQTTSTPPQFPAYRSSTTQQSPVSQLQTAPQPQTPQNSSAMQPRPSPQITSPTGSHNVLTQRVGNTQIIVVSPATGGPGSPAGQVDIRHSLPSPSVQNTPTVLQQTATAPFQSGGGVRCQNAMNENQQRTFIRIQPGNVRMSQNTAVPLSGLAQQNQTQRQTTKNDLKRKSNRNMDVPLDEPFIPPSMKSKPSPREGGLNTQQKVIVQSLPQTLESGYAGDSMSKHPEILLLDDVTLAAQTEVVSDVAMEVECTN